MQLQRNKLDENTEYCVTHTIQTYKKDKKYSITVHTFYGESPV